MAQPTLWQRVFALFLLVLVCGQHAQAVGGRAARGAAAQAVAGALARLGEEGDGEMAGAAAALGKADGLGISRIPLHAAAHADAALLSPVFDASDGDHHLSAALESLLQLHMDSSDGWDWWDEKVAQAKSAYSNARESISDRYDDAVKTMSTLRDSMSGAIGEDLRTLGDAIKVVTDELPSVGRILGALLFGFFNGVFMGIGDVFRDALAAPECEPLLAELRIAFSQLGDSMLRSVRGLFSSEARNGRTRRECFLDTVQKLWLVIKALASLCWDCKALRNTILIMVGVIAVALVVTGLLVASVYGVLVKVAGVVLNVVFGIQFVWRTVRKIAAAVKICVTGSCADTDVLKIIEGVAEIAGFIFQAVVMSGLGEIGKVTNLKQTMRTGKIKALKFEFNPAFSKEWSALTKRFVAIKDGVKVRALGLATRTADDVAYLKFAAKETLAGTNRHRVHVDRYTLTSMDDAMRKAADTAKETSHIVDDAVKAGASRQEIAQKVAQVNKNAADAAAKVKAAPRPAGPLAGDAASKFSSTARDINSRLARKYKMAAAQADDAERAYKAGSESLSKRIAEMGKNPPKTAAESQKMIDASRALSTKLDQLRGPMAQAQMERSLAAHSYATVTKSMDDLLAHATAGGTAVKNRKQLEAAFRFVERQGRATEQLGTLSSANINALSDTITKSSSYFRDAMMMGVAKKTGRAVDPKTVEGASTAARDLAKSLDDFVKSTDKMFAASKKLDEAAKSVAHLDDPYVRAFVDSRRLQAAEQLWGSTALTGESVLAQVKMMKANEYMRGMLGPMDEIEKVVAPIMKRAMVFKGIKGEQLVQNARIMGASRVQSITELTKKSAGLIQGFSAVHSTLAALGQQIESFRYNVEMHLGKLWIPVRALEELGLKKVPAGSPMDPLIVSFTVESEGQESTVRSVSLTKSVITPNGDPVMSLPQWAKSNDLEKLAKGPEIAANGLSLNNYVAYTADLGDSIAIGTDVLRRVRIFLNIFDGKTGEAPLAIVGEVIRSSFATFEGQDQPKLTPVEINLVRADAFSTWASARDIEAAFAKSGNSIQIPVPGPLKATRTEYAGPYRNAQPVGTDPKDSTVGDPAFDPVPPMLLRRPTETAEDSEDAVEASDADRGGLTDGARPPREVLNDVDISSFNMAWFQRLGEQRASAVAFMKARVRSVATGETPSEPPAAPMITRDGRSSAVAVRVSRRSVPPGGSLAWGSPLSGPPPPVCPATRLAADTPGACGVVRISSFKVDTSKLKGIQLTSLLGLSEIVYACRAARSPGRRAGEVGSMTSARRDSDLLLGASPYIRSADDLRTRKDKQAPRRCMTAFTPVACSAPVKVLDSGHFGSATIVLGGCLDADPKLGVQCTAMAPDGTSLGSFRASGRAEYLSRSERELEEERVRLETIKKNANEFRASGPSVLETHVWDKLAQSTGGRMAPKFSEAELDLIAHQVDSSSSPVIDDATMRILTKDSMSAKRSAIAAGAAGAAIAASAASSKSTPVGNSDADDLLLGRSGSGSSSRSTPSEQEDRVQQLRILREGSTSTENVYYHATKQWPTFMFLFGDVIGTARVQFACIAEACKKELLAQKRELQAGKENAEESDGHVPLPAVDFAALARGVRGVRGVGGRVPAAASWLTPKVTPGGSEPAYCPSIFAHRGVATSHAVENTIDAIYEAALLGLDGIEVDVFLTGSSESGYRTTILHDISLDRLLAYDQPLEDWNYFELQRFKAMTNSLQTCDLFPDLRRVLDLARALGVRIDVELKPESPLEEPFKGYNKLLAAKLKEEILGGGGGSSSVDSSVDSSAGAGAGADAASDTLLSAGAVPASADPTVIISGFDFRKLKLVRETSGGRLVTAMAHHGTAATAVLSAVDRVSHSSSRDALMFAFDAAMPGLSDKDIQLARTAPRFATQLGHKLASSARAHKVRRAVADGVIVGLYTAYDVGQGPGDASHSDAGIAAAIELGVAFIETDDPIRLEETYRRLGCREKVDRSALRRARAEIVGVDPAKIEEAHAVLTRKGENLSTRAIREAFASDNLGNTPPRMQRRTARTE
eukprot:TRINITY_DN1159_c0_g1_i4.p1 TRINITY_DN1159_c0_g1~~TRINITY_DN1159_c0_g1_i4.p1  ORF type:complete len:2077 (+),score=918.67 TRINITY_DN1159_c0_g1_i4:76-6231(+)